MEYSIKAFSSSNNNGRVIIKNSETSFGTTLESEEILPNPAELFLGSLSACILKSVERFSALMNFEYSKAEIKINSIRLEKPPRLDEIKYEIKITSQDDKLNINLLKRNIEKFGTIYNTVNSSCKISGEIVQINN